MAGDAGRPLPLGGWESDVSRVGGSGTGGSGAGGNGDGECAIEIGCAFSGCGELLQLSAGARVWNSVSACDCTEFEIFGEKWEAGDRAGSSTERGGLGPSGGRSPGDGAKISSGVGSVSGERFKAHVLGGSSAAGFRQGVEGREDPFDGGGLGGWRSNEEFGCGAGGESGTLYCG